MTKRLRKDSKINITDSDYIKAFETCKTMSRTLNDHEKNYSTIQKELLAIIFGCRKFRPYLYGKKFIIRTDHKPLQWLFNINKPNSKLLRWRLELEEFEYEVKYTKSKDNLVADALSSIEINVLENKTGNEEDNTSIIANVDDNTDDIDNSAEQHPIQDMPIAERSINSFKHQICIHVKKT